MNTLTEFIRDHKSEFHQEKLILEVTELLVSIMQDNAITKAELARRIGKSKAFVTQCLSGEQNLTLRTLSDLFVALEYCLQVGAVPSADKVYKKMVRLYPVGGWSHERCEVDDAVSCGGSAAASAPNFELPMLLEAAA